MADRARGARAAGRHRLFAQVCRARPDGIATVRVHRGNFAGERPQREDFCGYPKRVEASTSTFRNTHQMTRHRMKSVKGEIEFRYLAFGTKSYSRGLVCAVLVSVLLAVTGCTTHDDLSASGPVQEHESCRLAADEQMRRAAEERYGLLAQYDIYDRTLADCQRWYQGSSNPFSLRQLPCPPVPARDHAVGMRQLCVSLPSRANSAQVSLETIQPARGLRGQDGKKMRHLSAQGAITYPSFYPERSYMRATPRA